MTTRDQLGDAVELTCRSRRGLACSWLTTSANAEQDGVIAFDREIRPLLSVMAMLFDRSSLQSGP